MSKRRIITADNLKRYGTHIKTAISSGDEAVTKTLTTKIENVGDVASSAKLGAKQALEEAQGKIPKGGLKTICSKNLEGTGDLSLENIGAAKATDVARLKRSLGPYSERPDIVLTAKETNKAISTDGAKVTKSGWAIAQFTAELGNEYLFKPGATDGNVCVFAEYIDKIERRAIEYTYTYDETGRIATAKATYDGKTHSYTYAYGADATMGESCVITDDQTGQTVDYLPATFQTTVGSYQPMTLLNTDAELPEDGYCRFVSNFQSRSAIKVVVSYRADVADLTMKVVRDGMTASMCTQLSKINQKVDETKANIETLRSDMEGMADYYVGENDEVTGNPHFKNCKGNKEFLGEWHPFLIDHTDNTGEATHPVGQLMDNNHFRFVSGAFAPTVGITEAMRAACDVQLYTDAEHTTPLTLKNGVVVTDKAGAHPYDATEVYNSLGLVDLYDGEGNKVRQLLPWETTETKYSVMIGRYDTIYPVDRQTGEDGKVLSGIFKRQVRYDGIDTGKYPLLGTALSPCLVTTVGNKTRNFFFAYAVGDANTASGASSAGADMCSMFDREDRTYPRHSLNQTSDMQYARANNADVNAPVPFAEGGYHAINTFTLCMELLYGTKYLHDKNLFGSGISSNDSCASADDWMNNGGVRVREKGTTDWTYKKWGDQTPFGVKSDMSKVVFSIFVNQEKPKEQCMESQMAASWAVEFGIAEDTEYEAYGQTYRYRNVTGVKGLADGVMSCKVYRIKTGTCMGYKAADSKVEYDCELCLRLSLVHGMNLSGDVFGYWGGGMEMVGTGKQQENTIRDKIKNAYIDFYLEPKQKNWLMENKTTLSDFKTFAFEGVYAKIGTFGPPILGGGYFKKRMGLTPYKTENGGNIDSYQCCYGWTEPYWLDRYGQRVRIAVRLRGSAYYAFCSARFLYARRSAAATYVFYGGSAQCRIVQ